MFEIVLTSMDFEPVVTITNAQLQDLHWGQWDGPGAARWAGELPAGQYIVWALSHEARPTGSYQLSVRAMRCCDRDAAIASIGLGEAVTGSLEQSACIFDGFTRAEGFHLSLPAATGVRIELASDRFDPLLVITDLQMGVLWWNDDWSPGGRHAPIERRLPAGEYLVWIMAFDLGLGPFQLSVAEVEIVICPAVGTVSVGATVTGTLTTSDCISEGGRYTDPWTMMVATPTTVRIDLTSNQFDTFLRVEDEEGTLLAWDDDGGAGLNSRLVYTFPAGVYRVVVTSYGWGETGAYQLSGQAVSGAGPAAVTGGGTR